MDDTNNGHRVHRHQRRRSRSLSRTENRVQSFGGNYKDQDHRIDPTHHERSGDKSTSRYRYHRDSRSRSPAESTSHRPYSSSTSHRYSYEDRSEDPIYHTKYHHSSVPQQPAPRRTNKLSPSPKRVMPYERSHALLPSQQAAYIADPASTSTAVNKPSIPAAEKQKPNFALSGALAAESNTIAGTSIVLKYNEPPESRKPPSSQPWRLFVFKGADTIDAVELSGRSCWLFGRERSVVDYAIEHPSCSKQHAVLQFRYVEKRNELGENEGGVRPYVIDLESGNGTKVNGDKVPERRFVELMSGDVMGFGDSTREYVLILPPKE